MLPALLTLVLAAPPQAPAFPLRTDPPPKAWTAEQINEGLPYRWEKGTIHLLAWEVIEDDRLHRHTQTLVLKRFDQPTEQGGHRWLLAHVYHLPDDQDRPWQTPFRVPPPFSKDEEPPQLTDAQVYGHEFFAELPSDKQIKKFLDETDWTPRLGSEKSFTSSGPHTLTTKLAAGGFDRELWTRVFRRKVPTELFPELKLSATKEE